MIEEEIKRLLDDQKYKSIIGNFSGKISYKNSDLTVSFDSLTTAFDYVSTQLLGWKGNKNSLPGTMYDGFIQPFRQCRSYFDDLADYIKRDAQYNITQVVRLIQSSFNDIGNSFSYDSSEVLFMCDVYKTDKSALQGVCNYLRNESGHLSDTPANFRGALMAYEFKLSGKSAISKRSELEAVSVDKIKTDFVEYLSEAKVNFNSLLDSSEAKIIALQAEHKNRVSSIEEDKESNKVAFMKWFEASQSQFNDLSDASAQQIKVLEKQYEELLRLKKPAEYWNKRAKQLRIEGRNMLGILVALVLLSCLSLYFLLWLSPDAMLLSFIKDASKAIKWSIVFVTFISFLAYCIRAVAKVMFSSFHLARDAEEREQLTYVYLAMNADIQIRPEDRSLIMQALFSRADTGLLKDDSSPTMPNTVVDKLISHK